MARTKNSRKRPAQGFTLCEALDSGFYKPERTRGFRLLDLPVELVVRVLEHAVIIGSEDRPININDAFRHRRKTAAQSAQGSNYRRGTGLLMQPALTRTCRLLRVEGLKIFYSQNVFFTDSSSGDFQPLGRWLQCLSGAQRPKATIFCVIANGHFRCLHTMIDSVRTLAKTMALHVPECKVGMLQESDKVLLKRVRNSACCQLVFHTGSSVHLWDLGDAAAELGEHQNECGNGSDWFQGHLVDTRLRRRGG